MSVLDASALLAVLLDEPGSEVVSAARPRCTSAVNAAEARTRLVDLGVDPVQADRSIALLETPIADFTAMHARSAAELRRLTRKAGLSLGDRACLALAQAIGGKAFTADRAWATLDLPVEVEVIR